MSRIKKTTIISVFILILVYPALSNRIIQAQETQNNASQQPASGLQPQQIQEWAFDIEGTKLETTLVAVSLKGKKMIDQINIPDLDIIITPDNKRLIPLLRMLRFLKAKGQIIDKLITFQVEFVPQAEIDLSKKTVKINNTEQLIEIKSGISDITNESEIYIGEEILGAGFGLTYEWDEEYFGYKLSTDKELQIFLERRPKSVSAFSVQVKNVLEKLPQTEGPAYPVEYKPLVSFIETNFRTDIDARWQDKTKDYQAKFYPGATFWGHLFGGSYKLKARNDLKYPDTEFPGLATWLDRFLWSFKRPNYIVESGDTNIGLSDLVMPSVSLFGTSFKYLSGPAGSSSKQKDFLKGQGFNFRSVEVFSGYALLGSTVELWVNKRLIDTKIVEEISDAPPGYGIYSFEDISLLDRDVNEIKIVVKRTDGITEEFYREVLGANRLLKPGQWAVVGGMGTDREEINEQIKTKGLISGVQAWHGVSKDLTLGISAAMQDKFSILDSGSVNNYSRNPLSFYLAPQARYRLLNCLLINADLGLSYDPGDNSASAYILGVEYPRKFYTFKAQAFSYQPQYANGVYTISDREGYSLSARSRSLKYLSLQGGWLHIYNNTDGSLSFTQKEDLFNANITLMNLLPMLTPWVQIAHSDRIESSGKPVKGINYTVGTEAQVTERLSLDGRYSFGDDISISDTDGLKSDIAALDLGSFYTYGTRLQASYSLGSGHSLSAVYWDSRYQEQAEVTSNYNSQGAMRWRSYLTIGKKLTNSKYYLREYMEFNMNEEGTHRWGIKFSADEDNKNYYAGVYFTLNDMFCLNKDGLSHISQRGISFERRGVRGFVYLDLNGSGHRDKGEPGIPNISVLADGRPIGESNKKGIFYIPKRANRDSVDVSLDMASLPAIYTPTQGIQQAYWADESFTDVNLGVCILASLSGTIAARDEQGADKPFGGLRVMLKEADKAKPAGESVTANDGSYYIGEIKPGKYKLVVDKGTIPLGYKQKEPFPELDISVAKELNEIEGFNIELVIDQEYVAKQMKEEDKDEVVDEVVTEAINEPDKAIEPQEKQVNIEAKPESADSSSNIMKKKSALAAIMEKLKKWGHSLQHLENKRVKK